MGWDDNGLPTERRVQNYFRVRCDPGAALRPRLRAAGRAAGKEPVADLPAATSSNSASGSPPWTSRSFEQVWRRLGLSVDWSTMYRTIGDSSRRVSQRAFLRNLARGEAYLAEAPDAVGRRLPDRGGPGRAGGPGGAGAYHRLAFRRPDGGAGRDRDDPARTAARLRGAGRPSRRRAVRRLIGTTVHTPLFGVRGAGARAPAGRPGQGHGHRHGLHVRRHHRRHLVAGPAACPRGRCSAGTAGCWPCPPPGWDHHAGRRPPPTAAGGQDGRAGPAADRRAAPRVRRPARRAPSR